MKVAQVHNFYRNRGGEDKVLELEKSLLKEHGHTIVRYTKSSLEIKSSFDKVRVLLNLSFSKNIYSEFKKFCEEEQPDVIHVHNTFPLITPSVFYVAHELGIPCVYTLHNYRLIYPNALMLHQGKIDLRCLSRSAYSVVKDKVYNNSLMMTLAMSYLIESHKKRRTWHTQVDRFIALTEFSKEVFVKGGLPSSKMTVKPNFLEISNEKFEVLRKPYKEKDKFLFVGRISEEKGIRYLTRVWGNSHIKTPLYIIGDGELYDELSAGTTNSNIVWMGNQPESVVYEKLSESFALIFPSIWYEGFPMTILEALALGVPVLSSNLGSQSSIIKHMVNGLKYETIDQIAHFIDSLVGQDDLWQRLSKGARNDYLSNYTSDINYQLLNEIYSSAIESRS